MEEILKAFEVQDFIKVIEILLRDLYKDRLIDGAVIFSGEELSGNIITDEKRITGKTLKDVEGIAKSFIEKAIDDEREIFEDNLVVRRGSDSSLFYQIKSIYVCPIFRDKRIAGVIYVDRTRKEEPFSKAERLWLKFLGKISQLYIEALINKRLLKELQKDIWIGISEASEKIREEMIRLANFSPILILGETGTGKGLTAELLHKLSGRKGKFVVVSMPSLPETLFEAELFGSKKGAYTGAEERASLVGEADGGTLFFDEISEIPLLLQAKLLRFIETGLYKKLGEDRERKSDCKIVCASNKELWGEVERGRFRNDLFFRISAYTIIIPPLRERREDIEEIKGMSLERKLIIIKKVADALHEAHKKGLIHRDLKPSNIMVEIREDGEEEPYLIDFGLVKEINKFDSTFPGMIVGTLGYMAPEQIEGKIDGIDRRTDVYGLGAILYTILTGEPPFKGETLDTLKRAIEKEPIFLRKLKRNIPKDVETIVMKCLEKEPERRYQSAKELSEDIERFLKVEPIKAKPYSFPYRILKKVSRNKTIFAISSVALIAIIFLIGLAFHIQNKERIKRNYSIEFEQQVKYIEDSLWYTYSLPLHDIREEIRGVKDRLSQIERRIRQLGDEACGPGYYALGRGYFTLHEYEKAKNYLELAWDKYKYRIPNVSYFMSLSLTMLYEKENKNADRIIDSEVRNKIKDDIRKKYLLRIMDFTEKGKGAEIETWEYLDILRAYHDKKYSIALEKIETLKKKFPWFYDAIKLEGEIHRELGLEFMKKGEKEKAINNFLQAEQILLDLSKNCESDPDVYKSLSELEIDLMELLVSQTGESPEPRFKRAWHYSENALTVNPDDEEAYNLLSYAYWRLGSYLLYKGEDPTEHVHKSIEFSKKALNLKPDNFSSYAHIATSFIEIGAYLNSKGKNPLKYLENSISNSEKAIKLNPADIQSYNNIALSYWNIAQWEIRAGNDPSPYFKKGIEILEKGININPQFSSLFHTLGNIYLEKACYEKSQNLDPSNSVKRAKENYKKAISINPNNSLSYNNIAECFIIEGNLEIEKGNSPEPYLNSARFYLKKSLQVKPNFMFAYICGARIELAEARWKIVNGHEPELFFEKAIEFIKKGNDLNLLSVTLFEVKGEFYRLKGEWEMKRGASPISTAKEGIAEMSKIIDSGSGSGEIFFTRGFLYLLRAKFERKKEFYRKAINDFKKSFSLLPSLEKEFSAYLKEAEKDLNKKN